MMPTHRNWKIRQWAVNSKLMFFNIEFNISINNNQYLNITVNLLGIL